MGGDCAALRLHRTSLSGEIPSWWHQGEARSTPMKFYMFKWKEVGLSMTWALETHVLFGTGMPRNVAGTRLLNFTKTGGNSKPGSNDFSTLMNLVIMVLDALTEIFEWIGIQLRHFGAGRCHLKGICSIFEFEHLMFHGICNILVLRAKLPCQRYLQHFWVRTPHFPWNLQHVAARTVHGTW